MGGQIHRNPTSKSRLGAKKKTGKGAECRPKPEGRETRRGQAQRQQVPKTRRKARVEAKTRGGGVGRRLLYAVRGLELPMGFPGVRPCGGVQSPPASIPIQGKDGGVPVIVSFHDMSAFLVALSAIGWWAPPIISGRRPCETK